MRKLGEQWVEEFDGKNHMLKAMENTTGGCKGCDLQVVENCYGSCGAGDGCNFIIKDLGILNEDGCLPCPFCGEYPSINIDYNDQNKKCFEVVCINNGCQCSCETFYFSTLQQTIDAWNRRS